MNKKSVWAAGLLLLMALVSFSVVSAMPEIEDQDIQRKGILKEIKDATRRYRDLSAAEADGYAALLDCLSHPEEGAMGFHYVNGDLVSDTVLDPFHPEALVYEQSRSGKMNLVALEYIVFVDAWDPQGEGKAPPEMLGQVFEYKDSLVPFGVPPFYELHVWLFKRNPNGLYADWNPKVSCPAP